MKSTSRWGGCYRTCCETEMRLKTKESRRGRLRFCQLVNMLSFNILSQPLVLTAYIKFSPLPRGFLVTVISAMLVSVSVAGRVIFDNRKGDRDISGSLDISIRWEKRGSVCKYNVSWQIGNLWMEVWRSLPRIPTSHTHAHPQVQISAPAMEGGSQANRAVEIFQRRMAEFHQRGVAEHSAVLDPSASRSDSKCFSPPLFSFH